MTRVCLGSNGRPTEAELQSNGRGRALASGQSEIEVAAVTASPDVSPSRNNEQVPAKLERSTTERTIDREPIENGERIPAELERAILCRAGYRCKVCG